MDSTPTRIARYVLPHTTHTMTSAVHPVTPGPRADPAVRLMRGTSFCPVCTCSTFHDYRVAGAGG